MKPIEETHPSLCGKGLPFGMTEMYNKNDVQERTIDKAKLKETIERLFQNWEDKDWSEGAYLHSINKEELLKELELDK